jgi:hypothetical protein
MSTEKDTITLPATKEEQGQVVAGFGTAASFALLQRQAALLAASDLVPKEYRGKEKVANCVIALEMANRIGANPLMVMQNLYLVHGRPSWSSQFLISSINSTGKFTPLRFQISDPEPEKEVSTEITFYEGNNKRTKTVKEKIKNRTCVAWVTEKATGERLESAPVSIEMAVLEGWYSKSGSKWITMPELMLRYRAATFFARQFCPEVTMGLRTEDENQDVIDITPDAGITPTAESIVNRFSEPLDVVTGELPITNEEKTETTTLPNMDSEDDGFPDLPVPPCPECGVKNGHAMSCPNAEPPDEREPGCDDK